MMKILLLSMTCYLLSQSVAFAQSSESQTIDEKTTTPSQDSASLTPYGLEVIETRRQNRLDRVEVHHKRSSMSHIYDLNNPATSFEGGGISDRRMMGSWYFGRKD